MADLNQKEVLELLTDWEKAYPDDIIYEIRREWSLFTGTGSGYISILYNVDDSATNGIRNGMERVIVSAADEYAQGELTTSVQEVTVRVLPWNSMLQSCVVYDSLTEEDLRFILSSFGDHPVKWKGKEIIASLMASFVVKIYKDSKDLFRLHMTGRFHNYHLMLKRRSDGFPIFTLGPWDKIY